MRGFLSKKGTLRDRPGSVVQAGPILVSMLVLPASLQREPNNHTPLELVSSRKAAKSSGQLRSYWKYSCPSRTFVGGALGRWGQLAKRLCVLGQWTRWLGAFSLPHAQVSIASSCLNFL